MSAETNKHQTMNHFLLLSSAVTHIRSSKCDKFEQALSTETCFLVKMRQVQGLMSSEAYE